MDKVLNIIKDEFNLKLIQVKNTVKLIEDGNTIPFIARYRKEMTGELDDQILREINERLTYLKNLENRKDEIKRLIDEQDKLTGELIKKIDNAETMQEVEDIYRPFKPKKKTRATIAKNKGLEPLAQIILKQEIDDENLQKTASDYINFEKEVNTVEEALQGAKDIIAENISDNADIRKKIRSIVYNKGLVVSKSAKKEDSVYSMYYDYKEPVNKIAEHRILAINRGEKEKFLKVNIDEPKEEILQYIFSTIIKSKSEYTSELIKEASEDAYKRLIFPSIEREIRKELTEKAQTSSIKIFSENLKKLLLQSPVKGKRVLGLDPAYRTGCKLAVVDETGKVLNTSVVYPTPPQNKKEEAAEKITDLINKYNIEIIAIGNGTASRESEIFISDLIQSIDKNVYYMVVNEAGASVYSASKLGAEEFPDFDVSLRSAVSIARRLQDPLAELVKIDPKAIGVGQYQHDMNQKKLGDALTGVVEYCVNNVGVDLNTASVSLLKYISGINNNIAKNIVKIREEKGLFTNRNQLSSVPKLGPKAFQQCAGFLRIPESDNILDNTAVHPESYEAVENLFKIYNIKNIKEVDKIKGININEAAQRISIGIPTLKDILKELLKPGRDPREELPKPILRKEILDIKDLKPGMILKGTVRNVIDFGAFVDIGVHHDGLVHISQISERYIKHPLDVLSVGDIVDVKIIDIDLNTKRISLSMKSL